MMSSSDRIRLKDRIVDNVARAIKTIQAHQCRNEDRPLVLSHSDWQCHKLCEHLDHAFLHGLRHITHGYWRVVIDFTRKDATREIRNLQRVTTDLGRGRAWLCLALNENLLESYMRCFQQNIQRIKKYYVREALVLDQQRLNVLLTLTSGVELTTFRMEYDLPYLDLGNSPPRNLSHSMSTCSPGDDERVSLCSMDSSMSFMTPIPSLSSVSESLKRLTDSDCISINSSENTSIRSENHHKNQSGSVDSGFQVETVMNQINNYGKPVRSLSMPGDNVSTQGDSPIGERITRMQSVISDQTENDLEVIHVKSKVDNHKKKKKKSKKLTKTRADSTAQIISPDPVSNEILDNVKTTEHDVQNPELEDYEAFNKHLKDRPASIMSMTPSLPSTSSTDVMDSSGYQDIYDDYSSGAMMDMSTSDIKEDPAGAYIQEDEDEHTIYENHDTTPVPVCQETQQESKMAELSDSCNVIHTDINGPLVDCSNDASNAMTSSNQDIAESDILSESFHSSLYKKVEKIYDENLTLLQAVEKKLGMFISDSSILSSDSTVISTDNAFCDSIAPKAIDTVIPKAETHPVIDSNIQSHNINGSHGNIDVDGLSIYNVACDNDIDACIESVSNKHTEISDDAKHHSNVNQVLTKVSISTEIDYISNSFSDPSLNKDTENKASTSDCVNVDVRSHSDCDELPMKSQHSEQSLPGGQLTTICDTTGEENCLLDMELQSSLPLMNILNELELLQKSLNQQQQHYSLDLDNNMLLQIMLEVLEREHEEVRKLFCTRRAHTEGDSAVVFVLITNQNIYFLKQNATRDKFIRQAILSFKQLDYISLGVNDQLIQFVCTNRRKQFWLTTANRQLTNELLSTLAHSMELSEFDVPKLTVLTDATTQRITMKKYAAKESNLSDPHKVQIHLYSLIHWEDPTALGSPHSAKKHGHLLVQTRPASSPGWKPAHVLLRQGVLCIYDSPSDNQPRILVKLDPKDCSGCRRSQDSDRPHTLEIHMKNESSLQLSASTAAEANDWLHILCQGVAEWSQESFDLTCIPCCLIITQTKLLLCHEDITTSFFRTLGSASVLDVTAVSVDLEEHRYCIVEFESQEMWVTSGQWVLYFSSADEMMTFIRALSSVWEKQFQVEVPVQYLEDVTLQNTCQETVNRLRAELQAKL